MPSSSSLPVNSVSSSAVRRVLLVALLVFAVSLDTAQAQTQDPTASPSLLPTTSATPTAVGWGGCFDPAPGSKGGSSKLTIGSKTTLCLQIGNGDNWAGGVEYIRLTLQPKADEYTRFFVPTSYVDLVSNPDQNSAFNLDAKNITLGVASQDQLSFLRRYYDYQSGLVYPYLTAIVDVKGGEVIGITWDDACVFCGSDKCEENTVDFNGLEATQKSSGQPTKGCYITQEDCNKVIVEDGRTDCDLLVYVVWTGTDSNGKTFQSAANRFSNFPTQELQTRLKDNLPKVAQDFLREREL